MNYELDVFGQLRRHLGYDIAFKQGSQGPAVGSAEHQEINAESRREVENRAGRVFADGIHRQNADAGAVREIEHAVHDTGSLTVVLPTGAFRIRQGAGQADGQLLDVK